MAAFFRFRQLIVRPLTQSLNFRRSEWRNKVIDVDIGL
jgi:hypothetical protein